MSNIKTITIDEVSYPLEDTAARDNINILNASEETEGSVKNLIKVSSDEIKSNFQESIDSIYNAIIEQGTTPASKSLNDIVTAIATMATAQYDAGKAVKKTVTVKAQTSHTTQYNVETIVLYVNNVAINTASFYYNSNPNAAVSGSTTV